MLVFEILSILALFGVLWMVTYTMVHIMEALTKIGVRFIPASWLTTAWGLILIVSTSSFLLHLVRLVCGV